MLYLCLLSRDSLYQLSLLLEICIADQFRVVHLDHLQFLSRSELLLEQCLSFPSMDLFDLIDLSHKLLFTLLGLL